MHPHPPLVLFDGVCNLCNASVAWIVRRDGRARFQFASLQSNVARERLVEVSAPADLPDSIVLIDEDGVHTRSTAALRVARGLGFPWSLTAVFIVLPRFVRDALYDFVARNRYRWFGKRETCALPRPEWASRFLDAHEARERR